MADQLSRHKHFLWILAIGTEAKEIARFYIHGSASKAEREMGLRLGVGGSTVGSIYCESSDNRAYKSFRKDGQNIKMVL